MFAIAVHGGAGVWRRATAGAALAGVTAAADVGRRILEAGGSALDAVVAAVVELEDDPTFNAGTGCVLNLEGRAELDAGVMVGEGLRTGNVGGLVSVKNPVLVARKVMEDTHHVLLCGEGALRFARAKGFAEYDPVTPERRAEYHRRRNALLHEKPREGQAHYDWLRPYVDLAPGTVGAVALDEKQGLAAATSTGGIALKLPGRVGDTPIPGAGNYATPTGAASATGQGELLLRSLATKSVCDAVGQGMHASQAVRGVLGRIVRELGKDVGMIAVDVTGQLGISHETPFMPHAFYDAATARIVARMAVGAS
ncbi:MAG: isoaspartyl peptidase/L-asparaginase family protein [Betaproteobacteria bacterium]|nr:isoaspartyl peptidase/L-asparaginase family protein [Betaproteobacteria bacterium]